AVGRGTPDQARRLIDYPGAIGGKIAAAEFMNEPDLAAMGGAPAGYDAAAYGQDFRLFYSFMKQKSRDTIIPGPGSVGETQAVADLLAASRPGVDAISYHYYGTASKRCGGRSTPE